MKSQELSARHFTQSAIYLVEQLWPRWVERGTSAVTEQTILMLALWSILRWERKVGLVALERLGVDVDALARDVDRTMYTVREPPLTLQTLPTGQRGIFLDFSTPLAPFVGAAEHEALELGNSWVGSEHLLLAIVRAADSRLREVLDKHKIVYDSVQKTVVEILNPN